jgi:hypothetical protein
MSHICQCLPKPAAKFAKFSILDLAKWTFKFFLNYNSKSSNSDNMYQELKIIHNYQTDHKLEQKATVENAVSLCEPLGKLLVPSGKPLCFGVHP